MTTKECLKNLRLRLGQSQSEFGRMIHKDKTSISLYESGKRQPSFPTMRAIVNIARKNGIKLTYTDLSNDS